MRPVEGRAGPRAWHATDQKTGEELSPAQTSCMAAGRRRTASPFLKGDEKEFNEWGFIEATFRHSLGPGAVRGIAPRWEREGIGEPFLPPLFHGGRPGASFLGLTLRR